MREDPLALEGGEGNVGEGEGLITSSEGREKEMWGEPEAKFPLPLRGEGKGEG